MEKNMRKIHWGTSKAGIIFISAWSFWLEQVEWETLSGKNKTFLADLSFQEQILSFNFLRESSRVLAFCN